MQLQEQHQEVLAQLRDTNRQVQTLALDFQSELDLAATVNEEKLARNIELKGQIEALEQEKLSQQLIADMEDQRIAKNNFDKQLLLDRVKELNDEYTQAIEQGDAHVGEYIENINNQVQEEQQLSQEINLMANKSNLILHAKLNSNKNDFERLRNLGQNAGVRLEETVKDQDGMLSSII